MSKFVSSLLALFVLLVPGCITPEPPPRLEPDGGAGGGTTNAGARRPTLRGVRIVVDPGHGGRDPGAISVTGSHESDVNLAIASEVIDLLRVLGAEVIPSRVDDTFVPLGDRAALAETTQAHLLLSIHADSAERAGARGATVFIAEGASPTSHLVAREVLASMASAGVLVRDIKTARFAVLMKHSRPSILVECGFLSNRAEASLLDRDWYQDSVAAAIAQGVLRALGHR